MRYRRGLSGAIALLDRTVADAAARVGVEFDIGDAASPELEGGIVLGSSRDVDAECWTPGAATVAAGAMTARRLSGGSIRMLARMSGCGCSAATIASTSRLLLCLAASSSDSWLSSVKCDASKPIVVNETGMHKDETLRDPRFAC
jgi:hypothetical protein